MGKSTAVLIREEGGEGFGRAHASYEALVVEEVDKSGGSSESENKVSGNPSYLGEDIRDLHCTCHQYLPHKYMKTVEVVMRIWERCHPHRIIQIPRI